MSPEITRERATDIEYGLNILILDIRTLAARHATFLNMLDGAEAWEAERIALTSPIADCI